MIGRLELENYRGFDNYKLEGLKRVNLLVGRNNCGKTSILEAVLMLVSGGDRDVLFEIARSRGELEKPLTASNGIVHLSIPHFFANRKLHFDEFLSIRSDSLGNLRIAIREYSQSLKTPESLTSFESPLVAHIVREFPGSEKPSGFTLPLNREGSTPINVAFYRPSKNGNGKATSVHAQFIATDSLDSAVMGRLWNEVVRDGMEGDCVSALQMLDSRTTSVAFLLQGPSQIEDRSGGILLGMEGSRSRIPLGSFGEGMRRMLALSLAMATCKDGILLVDEIDTGLHYSVMGKMWKLVIETAKRLNIQVFATTHSLDCLRSLAGTLERNPELDSEVSLQKIERSIDHSVHVEGEEFQFAVEHDMEVR